MSQSPVLANYSQIIYNSLKFINNRFFVPIPNLAGVVFIPLAKKNKSFGKNPSCMHGTVNGMHRLESLLIYGNNLKKETRSLPGPGGTSLSLHHSLVEV